MIVRHHIYLFLLYAGLASTPVFGELAVRACSPLFFVALHLLAAGLILMVVAWRRKKDIFKLKDLPLLVVLGLVHGFIPNACEFWSLQYVTGAKAALIWSVAPFITALYAYVFWSDRLTLKQIIALVLGLVGLLVAVIGTQSGEESLPSFLNISSAEYLLVFAVIVSSYGWILFKTAQREGASSIYLNGASMLIGGIVSLSASYLFESWHPVPVTDWSVTIVILLILVLFCTLVPYNLYGYLLHVYSPTYISFAGFSEPFIAAIFQYFLIGSGLDLRFGISLALVTAGLYLYSRTELEKKATT